MSLVLPRISNAIRAVLSAFAALLVCAAPPVASAQTPTVITNPAVGVFTGGVNLTARITSASVSGVVITASRLTGTFPTSGVLRLCRGIGNACEIVLDAPYAAGASTVTFPSFTPRAIRQNYYFVQRVDAAATTTGGLDPTTRSGAMIVIVDSPEVGRENAVQVSQNCALSTSGTVKCWTRGGVPTLVAGLPANIAAISVGWTQSCALASGQVTCWGENDYGQLGDGTTLGRTVPVSVTGLSGVVTGIASGIRTSCALVGASASCWGINDYGQATGGVNAGTPAAVLSATPVSILGTALAQVQLGDFFGCALKIDRTVACWGSNSYGRLGNNVGLDTRLAYPAMTVNGILPVGLSVATAGSHSCVQRGDASVACWGANASGQLGRGITSSYEWQPATAAAFQQTALSLTAGSDSTCAILAGGGLTCWGSNSAGQLGIGVIADLTNSTTPPVPTPSSPIGLSGIVGGASIGQSMLCVALIDGGARCAGASGAMGNGSTSPSSVPVAVLGYGPLKTSLPAPTIASITRLGNKANITYADNLAANGQQIFAHQWGCKANNSTWTGTGSEVQTNETPGRSHVVQAEFDKVGPWQCQVRFRTADGVSAWSSWVDAIPARRVVTPTVLSATYDGAYGTITYEDNMGIAEGPVIASGAVCNVQYGAYQASGTPGCSSGDSWCYSSFPVIEPTAARHTIRMPLPPGSAGVSSVSCHVNYSTYDGPVDTGNGYVTLAAVATPPPSISSGRLVGNTGFVSFSDNLAASAGTVSSAVWSCTRIRDNSTLSSRVTVNEQSGGNHTISFPLNSSDMLQNPDTYRCIVRIATTGLDGPFSTPFTIGPNSPPVVSNFAFTSNNGVITGAFDINDPEGDQVKNVIAYFGSTPRSIECSSGTLGASWDVPRGGGRVQFNASQTNFGCAALTASAATIYGFVTAQDVNGLYATIVDAQSSNTPPAPVPVSTTTTYSIVFDAVPTTLAVRQAVDIAMRVVDQNGVTATQFRGPVRVSLSVSGIGFSLEDPNNPAAVTQSHRVVWFLNGAGKIRALRIHDPAVVRLVAVGEMNGTTQFGPVVANALLGTNAFGVTNTAKAAVDPSAIGQCRGVSSVQIRVGNVGDATLVSAAVPWTISLPQTSAALNSQFFTDWKNGTVLAYLLDADNGSLPPYGGVRPNIGGKTVTISVPSGNYRLVFKTSAGVALKPVEDMSITTGSYGSGAFWAWERNLPIDSRRRKVLYLHGVFGSALQVWGTTEALNKGLRAMWGDYGHIASMPPYACRRSTQQERTQGTWGTDNQKCGSLSVLLEDHFWADLRAKLEARGYEVVPVAWDWRLTPDQAQEEFLARAIEREAIKSGQPVDVVAHSMGGLVSLAFLSSQASNSRLSGYLDRLVMIGTPVAGSVSAYGLMEVADPLGLSDSLSRSVGKGPVYLGSDHVYSAIAGYLWNVQTGGRESLYECTSRSDTTCNFEIYTRGVTQEQRRTALTAQAPGGWFLYPNRQHLPFAATLPAPSSHLPSTATAFFQKSDSPNSFNSAALNAECRYDPTAATTITANHKTNVNLLLSQDVTTISTVGTKKSNSSGRALSINETTVKDWSEIQRYDDGGDGTVPVRGQLDALATFLGTTKASLLNDSNSNRNNPCATIGGFGEHGDLPTVVNVHSWVLRRLPYPGVAVANAPREEIAKVASPPVPQLMIATDGVVDFVVRDPALVAVGRTRLNAAPFEAASGQTSAVTRTDGNRVQVSIDNPTVGSTSVQLTGTSQEKITVQDFSALYADTVGQVSTASIRAMIRPGLPVNAWVAVQSTATSLPIGIDGPAAPTNIRTNPGATATAISWLAPSNSAVPVVGYRIYASPTQDDGWTLVGTTAANAFSYRAPYPAASNVQREISFVVVAVDAQDRLSRVPEFTSNRVIDHIEGNFVSVRGTPGATVTSAAITLPNNVPVTVSVSGGQMSVNGGAWGTTPLVINPGDTVALRGVTPATRGAQQEVVLTTGTSSTVFSVLGTPLPFCVRPTRPVADAGTFVRYLKLVTGLPLLQGLYPAAEVTTTNASTLEAHYRDNATAYDFNGDNATSALVDGVLYARYALGFRGAELVAGLAVGTARTTAQIEAALAACQ